MSIPLEKLFMHFANDIVSKYNIDLEKELFDVEICDYNYKNYDKNCLYIAKASKFNIIIEKVKNLTLILVKDDVINFDLASINNISIIEVNKNLSVDSIYQKAKNIFRVQSKYDYMKIKLQELVISDMGLKEIIHTASKIIENPLIVIDLSFKVLVSCPLSDISDPLWYDNVSKGYCSYEFISELKKLKIIKDGTTTTKPFEVICPKSPTTKLVSRIRVENKVVGNLVLLECNKKIKEEDFVLLELISSIISKELKKKRFYQNTKNTLKEEIIYDLLENNLKDEKILQERLNLSSLIIHKYICIYTIDISKYKLKHSIYERFLESQISKFFPQGYLIYYKNHLVVINTQKDFYILEEKIQNLKKFLSENNLTMGVSNKFTSLIMSNIFYNQALESLTIGKILNKNENYFQYNDIQPYVFIYRLRDQISLEDLANNELNLIREYDEKNQTDLYNTLFAYLKNNHNINKTSNEIHIHRNTLRYRLNKISELLNLDVEENDNSFKLYFSIKLINFYNKIKNQ